MGAIVACACSWILFFSTILEALTSKKKSKGRKEPKPAKPQAVEEDSDDMFKPPKMDDDDFSPFGGKGGLFSGGRGLFDDDDEVYETK